MRVLASAFAVLALVAPVAAQDFTDPRAVVEALYAPYFQPYDSFDYAKLDAAPLQSAGLNALFARDREEAGEGIGRIDFDPYVNGQDFELTDLVVAEPAYAGGRAVVGVTFLNFGQKQDMGYLLVEEGGAWKIDDMWAAGEEFSYSLREILHAPMPQ